MEFLNKDGLALAYEDTKEDLPPMLLVHGCGCDHRSLIAQAEFFRTSHRVVSVDLRGHGESDAPQQDYTMTTFANDLVSLCNKLSLEKPVMVGHSMGGNVILELAARFPEVPSALVMIDSVMFPPQSVLNVLQSKFIEGFQEPDYLATYQRELSAMCLPTDRRSSQLISSLQVPRHVLASALPNHTTSYDAATAASACRIPIAYIFSAMPLLDLQRFQSLTPQLVIARTLGSGHFSPIEVPDQINAMIARFLAMN